MRLLLDTHIWLWSLIAPENLSSRVAQALGDPSNELWLSPITVWETLVLARKKRIALPGDPVDWVRLALSKSPFKEAALNIEVAMQSEAIPTAHSDPADRFLAATAIVYELTLVTADRRLIESRQWAILPN